MKFININKYKLIMSYIKKDEKLYSVKLLDDNKVEFNKIMFYKPEDPYFFFSNFYTEKNPLVIKGEKWTNTEQYFQAMKFRGDQATPKMLEYSNIIKNADSPQKIKLLGTQRKNMRFGKKWKVNKKTDNRLINDVVDEYKDLKMRTDWNESSVKVMVIALYYKFNQYPNLKKEIMNIPDNTYIIEHSTRDAIWGDGGDGGTGTIGKNKLGKILTVLVYIIKYGDCSKIPDKLKKKIKENI